MRSVLPRDKNDWRAWIPSSGGSRPASAPSLQPLGPDVDGLW